MGKVLIIEDEVSIAELERDYLEISGFEVDISTDGKEGLEKALSEDYELVLLDLMLPGVNGYEICKQIRAMREIPIIIVSAKKNDIDKIRGLGLGADDYMTKPFSPSELVARVKAHIGRYDRLVGVSSSDKDIIEIRDLRIDASSRRVWGYGNEKTLTAKEFDILYFLAKHPNKVYSKEDLFKEVWGLESMGDISTVTVHIKNIREKIELNSSKPQFIETIWGVGYRFKG